MFRRLFSQFRNSSLVHATGIYTFTGIINGSVIFFLLPILTRYLSPEEYGLVSMFRVLVSFAFPLIGFFQSVGREYFDRERLDFPAYVANVLLTIFVNAGMVGIILYLLSGSIYNLTSFPAVWLWAVLLFALGKSLVQSVLVLWRVQVKPKPYGSFQISQSLTAFVMAIVLVVALKLGWKGAIKADAFAMGLFGLLAIYFIHRAGLIRLSFNLSYIRDIFLFSAPLILHSWGRTIVTMADRVFITKMVGIGDTGLYAAGYQVGMIIFLVTQSFNNAWVPYLFGRLKEDDERSKLKIVRFTYTIFPVFLARLWCWD
ncbi:MAG TPA: flippase [Bacteroidetes bacterium]|nr:flippase [Bacteroidota bacterium]